MGEIEIRYGKEERVMFPAPQIGPKDLVTQGQAVKMLGIRQQSVLTGLNSGRFTTVWHLGRESVQATSARLLLRSEVKQGRKRGFASWRIAPEVDDSPAPSLDGAEYGIERRLVRSAPDIKFDQVVSQAEAAKILGVKRPAIPLALYRGRFTTIWDLSRQNGSGNSSARMLLRSEVEQAAAGGRCGSRASWRMPPGK